jgi:arginyl-tRNA synthetase
MDPGLAVEDAGNIARIKSGELDASRFLASPEYEDIWDLVLLAGSLDARLELALAAQEPAAVARFGFELAQSFNGFYHKHNINREADAEKRAFLLYVTTLVREQLVTTLGLLGITAPEKM